MQSDAKQKIRRQKQHAKQRSGLRCIRCLVDHLEKHLLKRGNLGKQFHDLAFEIVEIAGSFHDFSGIMG